jgi:transcriptional regulator with XRE-family HTH domain
MVKSSYMSKKKTIGAIFKEARLKKGLTQVQVAEKAGIHWNTVAKVEREEQKPEYLTIKSIAKVLGIDISTLPD